jgi:hypothetical protein
MFLMKRKSSTHARILYASGRARALARARQLADRKSVLAALASAARI